MTNLNGGRTPLELMMEQYGTRNLIQEALEPYTVKFAVDRMIDDLTGANRITEMIRSNMINNLDTTAFSGVHHIGEMAKNHLKDFYPIREFAQNQADVMAPFTATLANSIQDLVKPAAFADISKMIRDLSSVGTVDFSTFARIATEQPGLREVVDAVESDDGRKEAFLEFYRVISTQLLRAGVSLPARATVVMAVFLLFIFLDLTQNPMSTTYSGTVSASATALVTAQAKKSRELNERRVEEEREHGDEGGLSTTL